MNKVVEGQEVGDSVYLDGLELEIQSIMFRGSREVSVRVINHEVPLIINGDWKFLREEVGVKLPFEIKE